MWFAAVQPAQSQPWLFNLLYKLLTNDPVTEQLLQSNPFYGSQPPQSVRAVLFRYQFSDVSSTAWYSRYPIESNYIPPLQLSQLRDMVRQMGWA